jgi:NADH-quinone oxidoreductase subunit C
VVAESTTGPDEATTDDAVVEPERAYGALVSYSRGQRVLHPEREKYVDTVRQLRDDGFNQLIDVTAVDYLTHDGPRDLPDGVAAQRFEVVVGLISHAKRERIRLRVQVPADDAHVPTLFDLYPGCEALEREVYDMYGIEFDDHPDLTRILMPEDWIGYPLRKDYAIGRIPVQFKDAPATR